MSQRSRFRLRRDKMKEKQKKSSTFIKKRLIFSYLLFITCCISIVCKVEARENKSQAYNGGAITPDSIVMKQLSDSVCDIVFHTKTAFIHKLAATTQPSDGDKTIGGFKVDKTIGKIKKDDMLILQFLLSDGGQFASNNFAVSMPYLPSYAIEFTLKKEKVSLLFSMASGEIAIVKNGKRVKYVQIKNIRLFALLLKNITNDNIFNEILKKK